jgi:hypothetical protein
MGRVYRHASLTIAAAASTSADSGCFQKLEHGSSIPAKVGTLSLPSNCQRHAKHEIGIYIHTTDVGTNTDRDDGFRPRGPLDSRAWVLQEELLSARLLTFGAQGLFWECTKMDASESLPTGKKPFVLDSDTTSWSTWETSIKLSDEPESPFGPDLTMVTTHPMRYALRFRKFYLASEVNHTGALSQGERKEFYLAWKQLVENYSSRALTCETDRFIAVQGLINQVSERLEDRCVAGLWESDFVAQLMWRADEDRIEHSACSNCGNMAGYKRTRRERRTTQPLKAPTWSWLGLDRRITYRSSGCKRPLVDILAICPCQHNGENQIRLGLRGILFNRFLGRTDPDTS